MLSAMSRLLSLLCLAPLLLSACLILAPCEAGAAADPVDLFVEALLDADTDSLDRILSPNFVFIGSNGHIQDKEHFLATLRDRHLVVKSASFKNLRESSAGPVRMVTGNGTFIAISSQPLPSGLMRVTLVADNTGPRERIVLVQLTPVIPTAECGDGNCLIR